MDALQLRVMHERILLCNHSNDKRARLLNILGDIFLQSYKGSGTVNDLNQALCAYNDAVRDDPGSAICVTDLGMTFLHRFERFGSLQDVHRSVEMLKDAVQLTPDGHPDKPSLLNNLGNSLSRRFQWLGDLNDINKSVLMFEDAVKLTPDGHPDRPSWFNNLGTSLFRRFERLGDLSDINRSVLMVENAVKLSPDGYPDKPSFLNSLGSSHSRRFERLGDLNDINKSVLMFEDAVKLTPDGHPVKPSRLSNLGTSLFRRFERLGDLSDINRSVLMVEDAVKLTPDGHPEKPSFLNSLGSSLSCRFKQLGNLNDINKSVLMFEDAVKLTPDGRPNKPSRLINLGNALSSRFQRLGDLSDINKSVLMFGDAVKLTPDGHPVKPSMLSNFGSSLFRRFEGLGDLNDINRSVVIVEDAVKLTPDGHPDKPSFLDTLGNSLLARFERIGDLNDINKSISMQEAAVKLTPNDHPNKPSLLNNLGNSLSRRFERLGDLSDINKSVLMVEDAVKLTPDGHPDKPSFLNSLGSSLFHRFEQLGDLNDINKSVLLKEDAVKLTPDGHHDKPSLLHNLGTSLLHRFKQLGDLSDINTSVLMFVNAVKLTPDGHPAKPASLTNLGISLSHRFEQLYDPQDSQELLCAYSSAACSTTGPAKIRFIAAKRWAKHAHIHQDSSMVHAYTTAIGLLPELAWLGLSITDRHHLLSQAGQVVRDAASAAIAVRNCQKAVEWLDQGRSVIWGQILRLRTPVDELRKSHPDLADELVSLSILLETAGTWSNPVDNAIKPQPLESIANQAHAFSLKRINILKKIRELPGFERFLFPKPISELSLAAKKGPVAIVNVSDHGCDALILVPGHADEVIHVPLTDFTIHKAQALATALASIVGTTGRSARLGFRERDRAPDDIISNILSELWFGIVCPVLNALASTTPASQDLGRIWWCPTGPLAFLPIHAAGLYGEEHAFGSKLSDIRISSYTPSLTALIEGFRPHSELQTELQLLAVTQPSAEKQSYIPGTRDEIKCIKQQAEGRFPVLWLDQDMATKGDVQKGMKESRWVHFACHGVQNTSPTESALLLAGSSQLTVSDIIQLNLPNADLAFLSACQTATGSTKLQDESIHLTAGMLLAGYRGVIGTMWSIGDNVAPQVAGDVYAHLLKESPPDPTRAAEALHLAVQRLREQLGEQKSFFHWVPFIHFGA
ncbi:TPR-like protein [Mycena pura]|uniref:TPR-like protein n=1 Tax=Mycena pura TaxID=153505 RepID=A0AAD6YH50_9AGAR|nr:TPR-like protein [Mycena pura]